MYSDVSALPDVRLLRPHSGLPTKVPALYLDWYPLGTPYIRPPESPLCPARVLPHRTGFDAPHSLTHSLAFGTRSSTYYPHGPSSMDSQSTNNWPGGSHRGPRAPSCMTLAMAL